MKPSEMLTELQAALRYKPLNRLWAKIEIVMGLVAAGLGLFLISGIPFFVGRNADIIWLITGLLLFVLGGYLAMAGHRSHLYQSNTELTAWLATLIRSGQPPLKT